MYKKANRKSQSLVRMSGNLPCPLILRQFYMFGRFLASYFKGNNIYEFLFAFLRITDVRPLSKEPQGRNSFLEQTVFRKKL